MRPKSVILRVTGYKRDVIRVQRVQLAHTEVKERVHLQYASSHIA